MTVILIDQPPLEKIPSFVFKLKAIFPFRYDYTQRPPEMSFPQAKRVGNPSEYKHLCAKQQRKIPDKPE